MRDDKRAGRREAIEAAAYALLAEEGYEGISMLKIAKRAKASNETLYRWYGDKKGLFRALVQVNAKRVTDALDAEIEQGSSPQELLEMLGATLLSMLLGDRAVALNRAAAGDPSGELGSELARLGRETVMPRIERVLDRVLWEGTGSGTGSNNAELYIRLLVGDLQIRRVIGSIGPLSDEECLERSRDALRLLESLSPRRPI